MGCNRHRTETGGEVHPDALVGESRRGPERCQWLDRIGPKADLLSELAFGGGDLVLTRLVQLAGGNLQEHLVERGPVLPDQHHIGAIDGHHCNRPGVAHHGALHDDAGG